MNTDLHGKTALITGASRGIGRAIALELAEAGADLILMSQNIQKLAEVAAAAEALGRRCQVVPCDLSDPSAITAAITTIGAQPVDVLVNNAGITDSVKFSATTPARYRPIMTVNWEAPLLLIQGFVEGMAARKWGRVLNVASVAGRVGMPYAAAYSSSKHALLGLTRSLALEYATRGVTINALCPGWVATDMQEGALSVITTRTGRSRDEATAILLKDVPQRRFLSPEEIAAAALFLVSPSAAGITGQALNVDGGLVMA